MESGTGAPSGAKWMTWVGWAMTLLPVGLLVMSATYKLTEAEVAVKGFADQGFPEGSLMAIGIVEVACTVLYLIPQTSVLGAILLAGYLGGAVVTHVRMSEPFFIPIVLGVLLWGGLFLRDARIRALIPLRKKA